MTHVVLFGIQGSGKGTQAGLLKDRQGSFSYFSTGDVMRALTSSPNAIGDYLSSKITSGLLVNDDFVYTLFDLYTLTLEGKNMLLDGYPRSLGQFTNVHNYLQRVDQSCVGIVLELSDDHARKRMMSRGRSDDTDEAISKRIYEYYEKTKPVLDIFAHHYPLHRIDASQSIDTVFSHIVSYLG